jgi:hypothetical protein
MQGQKYVIFKVAPAGGKWTARQIYSSVQEIRRLVPGPKPFLVEIDQPSTREVQAYRLFFGLKGSGGNYSIHSITEDGKREYQAIGPGATQTKSLDDEYPPSKITANFALPVGFHPAGHILLWEDARNCFHAAGYARDHWEKSARLFGREICGGTVGATPNGAGIIHWEAGKQGVDILLDRGTIRKHDAAGYQLVAAPSSVPDGRGIVGITRSEAGFAVNYIPVDVPLADVVNAWMYFESDGDLSLLTRHGGLFRDLKDSDQLYALYDSELYACGNHIFDQKYPAAKQGLIADCRLHGSVLRCGGIPTLAPPSSSFPQLSQDGNGGATNALSTCAVNLTGPGSVGEVVLRGRAAGLNGDLQYAIEGSRTGMRTWRSVAMPLVSVQAGKLAGPQGPGYLFTLERRPSTIDGEDGLRPYVYEAGPKGLVARWRGSALAWPLLDAALLPGRDGLLCALHRRDSFVVLQPDSTGVRTAVYRWNGFGFTGVEEPSALAACREMFQAER